MTFGNQLGAFGRGFVGHLLKEVVKKRGDVLRHPHLKEELADLVSGKRLGGGRNTGLKLGSVLVQDLVDNLISVRPGPHGDHVAHRGGQADAHDLDLLVFQFGRELADETKWRRW